MATSYIPLASLLFKSFSLSSTFASAFCSVLATSLATASGDLALSQPQSAIAMAPTNGISKCCIVSPGWYMKWRVDGSYAAAPVHQERDDGTDQENHE